VNANPKSVLVGTHFLDGDCACCEGALAAGADFAAGYPITPSTRFSSDPVVVQDIWTLRDGFKSDLAR
jgi:hypothetical protein